MRKSGINMEQVKKENRSLILKCINNSGPVSRKDIAATTGLTPASVTQITTALISEGILIEVGTLSENAGMAGRKKVLLDIDPDSSYVCTVNIESEMTTVAICDIKGNIVSSRGGDALITSFPTNSEIPANFFLSEICSTVRSHINSLKTSQRKRIRAVSIGVPGLVDKTGLISIHAYGIWNEPVDIGSFMGKELSLPVLLSNNVDAFATAETIYGTGREYDSLLVIKWGPGVGSTIVIDNNVYEGRHGKTAELGHFIVNKNGLKCSCGRRGCLETILSYTALSKIINFAPEDFGEALKSAPAASRDKVESAIDLFARSIVNTGTIIAPNRIILSGSLFQSSDIRQKLISYCKDYDTSYDEKRIYYTSLSDKESYIGPVAVFMKTLIG